MDELSLEPRKRVLPEHPAEITALSAELSEDMKKLRVSVELSRDDTRPDIELRLLDAKAAEISRATIVENFGPSANFTLHIRREDPALPLKLVCQLVYLDDLVQSERSVTITDG